jgi:hypothetical protein
MKTAANIQQLHALLGELLALHRELAQVIELKLTAMRRADVGEIERCVEREGGLAAQIQRQDGLRRCLSQQLARGLGLPVTAGQDVPLREVVARTDEAWGQRLAAVGAELGQLLSEVARVNSRAAQVARQMQTWHRALLQEAAGAFNTDFAYSRSGYARRAPVAQVIDTTS